MIIQLSPGQHEVLDGNDYCRLKLRVPSGWSVADIERGLPFKAVCTADHIWMGETDLRAIAQPVAIEPDPISGMVEKAKKYGFYDDASGAIRVHIEYY